MLKEAGLPITDENVFIAAACKDKGILYLTGKAHVNGVRKVSEEQKKAEAAPKKTSNGEYTVTVNGSAYAVKLEKDSATVNGVKYPLSIEDGIKAAPKAAAAPAAKTVVTGSTDITAPMPGLALRFEVKEGDSVKKNDILMVMEAMKMENEIYAPCDGVVSKICVKQGDQLQSGDLLMQIGGTVVEAPAAAPEPEPVKEAEPVVEAPQKPVQSGAKGSVEVNAPMPGLALRFAVKVGDHVNENDLLMVMEAMKMENEIYAPASGTIMSIDVNQGDQLQSGDLLMTIG